MTIKETAEKIRELLDNKKAQDVQLIEVTDKTTLADFFVIASGSSLTQVKALADEVEYKLDKDFGIRPARVEGANRDRWVLLDYLDIVVHIFLDEERSRYSLEKLWGDYQASKPQED